ncbi:hypothetical protein FHW69_000967 [Luteibacter sp. Sphag1AF]|uniref:DUF4850 domain-containing protein n=1 Tax=Luteibacter sp. Sphag1AF TaxID=2587031 RepID=UPI00160AE055|nr:DUF4850 domain-containing protein [Luteibacter sp. Sphag1AF]MBB3226377.1 hypothetical protein [Luteibacter sp. Sphag1AF]
MFRYVHRPLLAVALLLISGLVVAATRENTLGGPPFRDPSVQGEDYRLVPAVAKDATGKVIPGVTVQRILLKDMEGEWESADEKLPPFKSTLTPDVLARVQLFFASGGGWMVTPRGWKVYAAGFGVDGTSSFLFTAASGPAQGWLSTYDIPACLGCIYDAADMFFPQVHAMREDMVGPTPRPAILPRPKSMTRPDKCTVLLRYDTPDSPPVREAATFDASGDPFWHSIDVAIPDADAALADALMLYYRQQVPRCGTR